MIDLQLLKDIGGEGGRLTALLKIEEIYFCVPAEGRCLPADVGSGEIRFCGSPEGRNFIF